MKGMSMQEHRGEPCRTMGMCDTDKMGDIMGIWIEHADMMGLTYEHVMKVKPFHREMQKKQARFMADLKIAQIELL
jgi:hypothetical protein